MSNTLNNYENIELEENQVLLPVGLRYSDGRIERIATIREMIGEDEEKIANPKNQNKITTILLKGLVLDIGGEVPTDDTLRRLTTADRDYLLLQSNILTFGDGETCLKTFSSRCSHCQSINEVTVDLMSEIEVRYLQDDEPTEFTIQVPKPIVLPGGEEATEVVIRLPLGMDIEACAPTAKKNVSQALTSLLRIVTKRIGSRTTITNKVFESMSLKNRQFIGKELSNHAYGPKFSFEVICDGCGEEFITRLPIESLLSD